MPDAESQASKVDANPRSQAKRKTAVQDEDDESDKSSSGLGESESEDDAADDQDENSDSDDSDTGGESCGPQRTVRMLMNSLQILVNMIHVICGLWQA